MLIACLIAIGAIAAVLILASVANGNPPIPPLGVNGEVIHTLARPMAQAYARKPA